MARYRVGFDGEWQASFDDETEARTWAAEVAETGRTVLVVRRRMLRSQLVLALPDTPENREGWNPGRGGPGSTGF